MTTEVIPRYNYNEDYQQDFALTKRAATSSAKVVAGGLTLAVRFALTKVNLDGTPPAGIAGLTFTVTELSAESGSYRVECDKSQTAVALRPYRHRELFMVFSDVDTDCAWQPYLIVGERQIDG